jgi:hypothetical protein
VRAFVVHSEQRSPFERAQRMKSLEREQKKSQRWSNVSRSAGSSQPRRLAPQPLPYLLAITAIAIAIGG